MNRILLVAAVALIATPSVSHSQQPQKGTWELGGFGRFNWYDNSFNTIDSTRRKNSWGGGIRAGYFLAPRWNLEFDGSANASDMDFPGGATSVGLVYLPFHLGVNYNAPLSDKFFWHVGPRINFNSYRTSEPTTNFTDKEFEGSDWGVGAITGFRYKLSETWSVRLDGNIDYIPSPLNESEGHTNTMMGLQAGLSAFLGGKCRDKIDSIRVEPKSQDVMVGDRVTFRVSGYDCDGDVVDLTGTSTGRVVSGAPGLAGLVFTASQVGCHDFEITGPGARRRNTDTARICVRERPAPPPPTLDRCELSPATSANVPPGETITYRVTGFYSDGTSRDLPSATLRATEGSVSGRTYTAPTNPGTYTVTADCGSGRTATASVTVQAVWVTVHADALFGFDRAVITSQTELDSLRIVADLLKQYPNMSLTIHGHTDWTGTVAYNERLGLRRIEAVLEALAGHGIDRARMESWTKVSLGECQPTADNRTRAGRAQNRRAEVYDSRSAPTHEGGAQCRDRP